MDEEPTIPTSPDIYKACADYHQPTEGPRQPAFTHRTSLRGLCEAFATRDGCPLSHDQCPMKHYCRANAWSDKTLVTLVELIPANLLLHNSAGNVQDVLVAAGKDLDRLNEGTAPQSSPLDAPGITAGVSAEDWIRGKIACLEERVRYLQILRREGKQNTKETIKKAIKEKNGAVAAEYQAVKDKHKAQKENEGGGTR